jgi:hypothetical protein
MLVLAQLSRCIALYSYSGGFTYKKEGTMILYHSER